MWGENRGLYRGKVPKAVYILLAVIFVMSATSNPTYAEQQSFKDVDEQQSSWPYVRYLANEGAATGYPDGTFRPQEGTTRAQVAKIITLLAGWPLENPEVPTFGDVPSTHWAYPYVETAVKHGILRGYSNKTFLPNRLINKAELAVASLRFTGKEPEPTIPRLFNDVTTDYWAYPAIAAAIDAGMLNWADGKVEPDAPATRARTAKALAVASLVTAWEEETVLIASLHVNVGTATIYQKGSEKGQELTPDQEDSLVGPGDKISTGSQGTARIAFEDGSALELDPDTTVEIVKTGGLRTIRGDGIPISSVDDLRLNLIEGVIFGGLAPRYEVVPDTSQSTGAEEGSPADQPAPQSNESEVIGKSLMSAANQGIAIVADSSTVYADGKTKVVITVKLVDAEGGAVKAPKEGITVNLSASAGNLSKNQIKISSGGSEGKATWTAPGTMPQGKIASIEASGKNILGELAVKIMEPPWWRQSQSKKVRVTVDMPWGVAGVRGSFFKVKVVKGEQHVDIIAGEGYLESNNQVVNLTQGTEAKIKEPGTPPTDAKPITVETIKEWQKVLEFVETTLKNIVINAAADTIPRGVDTPPVTVDKLDNYIPATIPGSNTGGNTGGQGTGTPGGGTQGTGTPGTGTQDTGTPGTGTQGTGTQGTGDENTGTTSTNLYSQILITIQDEQAKLNKLLESILDAQKDSTDSGNTDQGPPPDTEPPTVTVKPAGGSYRNVQNVELVVSEQPATVFYTLDGATPTASSNTYNGLISIGNLQTKTTTQLKFIAVDGAGNWSPVNTQEYTVDPIIVTYLPGGTYRSIQNVTLTPSVQAAVYYTTDGSIPTTDSNRYTTSLTVGNLAQTSTTTLKFMAVDSEGNRSQVYSVNYLVDPITVVISPAGGEYKSVQYVTLNPSVTPASVYYTTNGTPPTPISNNLYTGSLTIGNLEAPTTTTLKYMAVDTAGNQSQVYSVDFTVDPILVEASPQGGIYGSVQNVVLSPSVTSTVYYTTDGNTPTADSNVYVDGISIGNLQTKTTTQLKFIAVDGAGNWSQINTQEYTVDPIIVTYLPGGTYRSIQNLTLTPSVPAAVYYTTDGSIPTTDSNRYTESLTVGNLAQTSTTTLKFMAVDLEGNRSQVYSVNYLVDPITVVISPAGGEYKSVQYVTLNPSVTPASVYYTTNGTPPTPISNNLYTGSIAIGNLEAPTTTTLKYMAVDTAGNQSQVYSVDFTVDPILVEASPQGGIYGSVQNVVLSPSVTSTVYYTTDGNTPTADSNVYIDGISIGSPGAFSTTPLKFRAVDAAGNWSQTYTGIYEVDMVNPVVQASPDGGYHETGQTVALLVYDNITTSVYYTTDGTDPALNGLLYTQPIDISSSTTLKVLAVDSVGNRTYYSGDYIIKPPGLAVTVADPRWDLPSPTARVAVMKYDEGNGYYTQVASGVTNGDGIISFSTAPLRLGENYLVLASNSAGNFLYYRDINYSGMADLTIKKNSSTRIVNFSALEEDGVSPLAGTLYASLYVPHGETNAIAYSYTLAYMNNGQSEIWLDPGSYYFQVGSTTLAYYIREQRIVTAETSAVQLQAQNMVPVTLAVYGSTVGSYQSWLNPRNPDAWITPNLSNTNNGLYHLSAGSYSLYAWLGNYMGRYEVGPNNAPLQPGGSLNWSVGGDLTGYLSSNAQYFVPGNSVIFYPGIIDAYGNAVTDILGSNLERVNVTVTITISTENYQEVVTKTGYWKNIFESEGLNWTIPGNAVAGTYTASMEINGQSAGTFLGTMTLTVTGGN